MSRGMSIDRTHIQVYRVYWMTWILNGLRITFGILTPNTVGMTLDFRMIRHRNHIGYRIRDSPALRMTQ